MKRLVWSLITMFMVTLPVYAQQYNWRYQSSANCQAMTEGKFADLCWDTTEKALFKCVPASGNCDTAGEWVQTAESTEDLDAALGLKADDADLSAHTGNTSNPHSVTKAQVGLGNADNTSDLNKPISTATQSALDGKQPVGSYLTSYTETDPIATAKIGTLTSSKWCTTDGTKINCTSNEPTSSESDPIYGASSWATTTNNASDWDMAYGWGDHSAEGYLTSYTETDPKVGSLTSNKVPKWGTTALTNSIITDSGTTLSVDGSLYMSGNITIGTTSGSSKPLYIKDRLQLDRDPGTGGENYTNMWGTSGTPTASNYVWQFKNDGSEVWFNATNELVFTNSNARSMTLKGQNLGIGSSTPAQKLDIVGNIAIDSASAFYIGGASTDGSWRMVRNGNNLELQRRESGAWVFKGGYTP